MTLLTTMLNAGTGTGMDVLDLIALLVFLAAIFTFINIHYLKLPATIGLMILALVMSVVIVGIGILYEPLRNAAEEIMLETDFTDVLLNIMLNFLLFAGALHVDFQKLKEEAASVLVLATVGTLLSTFLVATAMYYVIGALDVGFEVTYIHCLLFGALISPTDPIAVLAILKTTKISKNLSIKIEGESLFNDGIGVVVFLTILGIATSSGGGESMEASSVGFLFGQEVFGGILMGLMLGFFAYYILEVIDNEHMELEVLTTLSLVLVGGQAAQSLHISGPLCMVVMGLVIGQGNSEDTEEEGIAGEYVLKFWELVDETLNAILFILIGLQILIITFNMDYLLAGIISIFVTLGCRLVGIGIPLIVMGFFKKMDKGTIPILTWGGLRGGLSVALALSLTGEIPKDVTELIVAITYCVALFSILVQGMTIEKLVKRYAE
ncbi:sodium:proton antiporter [Salibacteraceae bacterium]|nr:sodium:proton antiporter [Salibacteraceae bacterium]